MSTPKQKKTTTPPPAINPFFTTLNGISALFTTALSAGIVILLINAVSSSTALNSSESDSPDEIRTIVTNFFSQPLIDQLPVYGLMLIIITFSIVVGTMIHGIQSYTALKLSKNEKTTIGEAFNATLSNFGNYLLLYVWLNIKTFLWTLLLIIPGIIAYYRYSFAGIVFFDKDLRLNAAIKESSRLTKGGLMTLFSSQTLFNMMTLYYIDLVVWTASVSQLYRSYTELDKTGQPKPPVHWLSWVTLALPFVGLLVIALLLAFLFAIVGLSGITTAP